MDTPIGAGEEWRTLFEAQLRYDADAVKIVQPEMGHTGITEFTRISKEAHEGYQYIAPRDSGLWNLPSRQLARQFLVEGVIGHEYQHSVVEQQSQSNDKSNRMHTNGNYQLSDYTCPDPSRTDRRHTIASRTSD